MLLKAGEKRLVFEGLLHVREQLAADFARTKGADDDVRRELEALENLLVRLRRHGTAELVYEEAWSRYLARRGEAGDGDAAEVPAPVDDDGTARRP